MKVEASLGSGWLGTVQSDARRLEALGYDGLLTADYTHEISSHLTLACAATERVELSTGVMIAFARSPFVVAQQAWDLQELTKGRLNLGLGAQLQDHNELRFSSGRWVPPAPRLQEYVRVVRAIWDTFQTGAPPSFAGKYYQFRLCPPDFNPGPMPYGDPKVFISAAGAAMARVAGRVCDGVRAHPFCTDKYATKVLIPNIRQGAAQAHRSLAGFELAGAGMMSLGETESEAEQNRERLRMSIATYGANPAYHPVLAQSGYEGVGMQLRELVQKNQWEKMPAVIPENLLHDIGIVSTYDGLPKLLRMQYSYLSRITLPFAQLEAKDPERLRHLIAEIQRIETRSFEAVAA